MKITALMGSPRLGDSYHIVLMVEERLRKQGLIDFEYVFLKDHDIAMCKGCFRCVRIGEEQCPIKDDVPVILEKMKQSDGLIFASPVYSLGITGLMKNFKDRTAFNAHRPTFWGKKAMAVVTSEGTGIKGTLGFLHSWDIWGIEFTADVGIVVHPTLKPTDYFHRQLEKKLDKAAGAFYKSLGTHPAGKPPFIKVMQFHILKYMASIAKDGFPADYAYYKDKKEYYYDTPVHGHHIFLAKAFRAMASRWMSKNYVLE